MTQALAAALALALATGQATAATMAFDGANVPPALLKVGPVSVIHGQLVADCGFETSAEGQRTGGLDALFSSYFVCRNTAPQQGFPVAMHCGSALPVADTLPAPSEALESLDRWQLEHGQNPSVNDDVSAPRADLPRWREPVSVSASAPPGEIRALASEGDDNRATACT